MNAAKAITTTADTRSRLQREFEAYGANPLPSQKNETAQLRQQRIKGCSRLPW